MKTIKLSDYKSYMGKLIDIRDKSEYNLKHVNGSINIPYNDLLFNYQKYLNKNEYYFLICSNGVKSKRATNILSFYGYHVTNVIK